MKALYFDRDGFVLLQKRLDNGKFQWPRNASEVRPLTRQEFRWLMEDIHRCEIMGRVVRG